MYTLHFFVFIFFSSHTCTYFIYHSYNVHTQHFYFSVLSHFSSLYISSHLFSLFKSFPLSLLECEKLIRKMLQLDPAKRIPLSKVLEHKWMQDSDQPPNMDTISPLQSKRSASGNLLWNEQVLLAIQRLNSSTFTIEAVKQVRVTVVCVHHVQLYTFDLHVLVAHYILYLTKINFTCRITFICTCVIVKILFLTCSFLL